MVVDPRHRVGRGPLAGCSLNKNPAQNAPREETMRRLFSGALGAGLLCALALQVQAFPDRPIRLIIPYGTGGITDIAARILAPRLGEELGQQVVVDNRPGGAGMIGFGMAAQAPADGHTLVLANN